MSFLFCIILFYRIFFAGFNDLATLFSEVANEWSDKNEKKPTEVMAFANSKAWWKCRTCGYEWNTLISTRSVGSKCPCCSGYTFIKGKPEMKEGNPIRLYSLDEITEIFCKLGLRICNSFADFSGKPSSDNDIQLMVYSIRE